MTPARRTTAPDRPGRPTRAAKGRSRRASLLRAAGVAAALAIGAAPAPRAAAGAETQWWIADDAADHKGAESQGVVVRPDGTLELGPSAISTPVDSLSTIWAIAPLADGSVALAGDGGRIERWTERDGVRPWVRLPVGQILSLAGAGDGVIAGTAPEGLVYRIGARGDTALLARTDERYVWALAPASGSAWYAATGTRGRLLRIESGTVRVVFDSDESNLVSLASDGAGGAYAGGDSRGRIFHVRADGTARALFDAPEDEVRALAVAGDGSLHAAALAVTAVSGAGASAAAGEDDDEQAKRPAPQRGAVAGGKAVVYRLLPDSAAIAQWTSPQPFVFALAPAAGGMVAATGNRAGVYLLEGPGRATQWLAAPQGQVTALAAAPGGRVYAATSNPGALWRIGPGPATRGELRSSVLDAKRFARFGRIRWRGEARGGRIELHTRSGNTATPDTAWSEWRGGSAGPDGFRIASPPGRYLQWKLTLAGGDPRLESVEVAWREQNLPPTVADLVVAPQGQGFREGDLTPRSEPVTQTLPGGQKVEYSVSPSKGPRALRDLPMWARGLRTVQWRAEDPNGDALEYRVELRSEGGGAWTRLGEDLDATAFTWDTGTLPDGRYRLRVTATDRRDNPVGEERSAEATSEPFTVDNTPPVVIALEARGERGAIRVRARAEDGLGPLARMEVAVDDGDWRTATPEGGLADDRALAIDVRLDDVEPGEHTVSVRAVDLAGNSATRAARVAVPPAR